MEDFGGGGYSGQLKYDEKQNAMYCHMSALAGVIAVGMTFLGPLIVWLAKKDSSQFVDANGKEALNFQINIDVIAAVLLLLGFINEWLLVLPVLVILYGGVMAVIAGMKAGEGQLFQYPATIRLLK